MKEYLHALRAGFGGLLQFSGRSTISEFWLYAGTIVALTMVGVSIAAGGVAMDMMQRMMRFAAEHPDLATISQGPGFYSVSINGFYPELMPDLNVFVLVTAAGGVVTILLLAGAIVRRLRDVGKGVGLALFPLPFGIVGFGCMAYIFGHITGVSPPMAADFRALALPFFGAMVANLAWIVCLILLVTALCGRGQQNIDRFGPTQAAPF